MKNIYVYMPKDEIKGLHSFLLTAMLILISWSVCLTQTPTDAIMMEQRESCFALIYDHGSFDQYWEGSDLRSNATIATVSRNTILPMAAIGLHNRINLIIAVPHVQTESSESNGGKFAGAKGFQDLSLALKGRLFHKAVGQGDISLLGTVGFSTPITNYLSDYRPYSIGFGASEWSFRGIAQYKLNNGLYVRAMTAYLRRGQTEAERDYYYNNGGYYTAFMDVPSAWNIQGVAGIWLLDNSLKLEAAYTGLKSTSGDDIRAYNAAQPTNKVQFDQVGFSAQYYFQSIKGLGILASYSQIFNGRNEAKFSNTAIGVTYQFKI